MAESEEVKPKKPIKEPCQKYACAIQSCLKAKNYDADKCQDVIEAMKSCCAKITTYSYICQGFNK